MTTYPLPTLGVTIDDAGITAPPFADILASLQASVQGIYGSDIYIDPDSQDGQMLGIVARAINDNNQGMIATYNAYSPTYAQGAGLSSVVKINGLQRDVATNSTVDVTLVGQAFTFISNGSVGDNLNLGTKWALPAQVTIPIGGSIDVTATCTQPGAIQAAANTITEILTPTAGWQTSTNADPATPGAPVENDPTLRQRQSVSTSLPAITPIDAIVASVANVTGVQRYRGYENDTGSTDLNTIPAHSISMVVQGGDSMAIAAAIAVKKSPGTGTYGTTSELVIDPIGVPNTIKFYILATVDITVGITIRALTGFVSTTEALIQSSIAIYLSGLSIGELSYFGRLYNVASLQGPSAIAAYQAANPTTTLSQDQIISLLNTLAATYSVVVATQSRSVPLAVTKATSGPFMGGATVIDVLDTTNLYVGAAVGITLDNAATLNTTIAAVTPGVSVTLNNAVPGGREILTNGTFFLTSDVMIAFNEAAEAATTDVTITVV